MSNYLVGETSDLFDPATGLWVGVLDKNGKEQVVSGGGASAFADLTDKTTADLPAINAPLAVALGKTVTPLACTTSTPTNIDWATYANKTIELTVTGSAGLFASLVLVAGGWTAGDRVTFRLVSLTTASGVNITSSSGAILTGSQVFYGTVGSYITLKRNAANTGWNIEQSFPLWPTGGGTEPYLRCNTFTKATVMSTDFIMNAGSFMAQYSNNTTPNGAIVEIKSQGTLNAADVSGTYALSSRSRTSTEIVDYTALWKIGLGLHAVPHYNVTAQLTGTPAAVLGKRYTMLATESTRYTDSKHWGGFLIGSISGASYNGLWALFDDFGNFVQYRGKGTLSEQRDTGTASFTVAANTAQVALAGSGTITVTFPQTPFDGQDLTLFLETAYTGITLSSGAQGAAFIAGTIGVTAGSFGTWSYRSAGNVWRRKG